MNSLLCFNEEKRISWPEVSNHEYLYMDNKDFIPLRQVELIQTCDVESNKLDSVLSVSSQAYDTSNMLNSYRDDPENTETPELNIEKEEESDEGFILPGRPNDEDE